MTAEKNSRKCRMCGKCCSYIAIEIDDPNTKQGFNNLIWLLMHKGTHAYCDYDNRWFIEVKAECKALAKNKLCLVHRSKPKICRDYSPEECTANNSEKEAEKISIRSIAELKRYYESKNFRFKLDFPEFEG